MWDQNGSTLFSHTYFSNPNSSWSAPQHTFIWRMVFNILNGQKGKLGTVTLRPFGEPGFSIVLPCAGTRKINQSFVESRTIIFFPHKDRTLSKVSASIYHDIHHFSRFNDQVSYSFVWGHSLLEKKNQSNWKDWQVEPPMMQVSIRLYIFQPMILGSLWFRVLTIRSNPRASIVK